MTGLVRKATLLVACGLLVMAGSALAGRPYAPNSVIPAYISVVGTVGATFGTSGVMSGTTDPSGQFTIVIRDIANLPVNNSSVILDFVNCTDVKICQDQNDVTKTVACPTVAGVTNTLGQVTFNVVGSGLNVGGGKPYPTPAACCQIWADGYSMGYAVVPVYDQDGAGVGGAAGMQLADCRAVLVDYGIGAYCGRSDLDKNGALTLADFRTSLLLYGIGASATGCGTSPGLCP
jgi:hypothetical protein